MHVHKLISTQQHINLHSKSKSQIIIIIMLYITIIQSIVSECELESNTDQLIVVLVIEVLISSVFALNVYIGV